MKDRIRGGAFTNGTRLVFVKPTKEGYELTEKGVRGFARSTKTIFSAFLRMV